MQSRQHLRRLEGIGQGFGTGKVRVWWDAFVPGWWQEVKIEVQRVASRVAKRIYNLIR
ncbi:MAG: hypothetical protein KME30_26075 [Iphinoe sp. HA4291-MV1]|nr:hypothetical protein [Iphinoe sp. HA4291-MV1]